MSNVTLLPKRLPKADSSIRIELRALPLSVVEQLANAAIFAGMLFGSGDMEIRNEDDPDCAEAMYGLVCAFEEAAKHGIVTKL